MSNVMNTKTKVLRTLKGESIVAGGIGVINGFIQVALVQDPEGRKTRFLYELKLDHNLFEYLKETSFFWEVDFNKTVIQ